MKTKTVMSIWLSISCLLTGCSPAGPEAPLEDGLYLTYDFAGSTTRVTFDKIDANRFRAHISPGDSQEIVDRRMKTTRGRPFELELLGPLWIPPTSVKVDGNAHVALMVAGGVEAFDPETGERLWSCEGMRDYVCNTPVFHDGVLYCASMNTHGGSNTMAIRPPRNGQAEPEVLWSVRPGPAVSSPAHADGNLYFTNLNQRTGRQVWCLSAKDGQTIYRTIFDPAPGVIYASPLLADGKLYYVSEREGTFVVAAQPEYKLLAHNVIATDDSVFNASPAPLGDGKLLLRSDARLYCIGTQR